MRIVVSINVSPDSQGILAMHQFWGLSRTHTRAHEAVPRTYYSSNETAAWQGEADRRWSSLDNPVDCIYIWANYDGKPVRDNHPQEVARRIRTGSKCLNMPLSRLNIRERKCPGLSLSSDDFSTCSIKSSGWNDLPTPSTSSVEWRAKEARDLFVLLRDEYKSSKRMHIFKRYKVLERILNMFTSEAVLQKLLFLTKAKAEEEGRDTNQRKVSSSSAKTTDQIRASNETIEQIISNISDSDDSVFLSEESTSDSTNSNEPCKEFVKNAANSLASLLRKNLSMSTAPRCLKLSSTRSFNSSYNDPGMDSSNEDYILPELGRPTSQSKANSIGNLSAPPSGTLSPSSPSDGFQCLASPASSYSTPCWVRDRTDDGPFSQRSTSHSDSSPRILGHSTSQPATPKPRYSRSKMGPFVLRRDQVLQFQIPPQRTSRHERHLKKDWEYESALSSSDLIEGGKIGSQDTSFPSGTDSTALSGLLSTECLDKPVSAPARKRRSRWEHLKFISPRMYKESDFFTSQGRTENVYSIYAIEMEEMNICLAHQQMLQLKKEYEGLKGKNKLLRYRKMKSLLKACMQLQF